MKAGDGFVIILIIQYVLAAIAYSWQGAGWKALYWVGAALISCAVLKMR